MKKITGFLINQTPTPPKFDIFDVGLECLTVSYESFFIHLWGIGELQQCTINEKYTLSFPLHDDLLDRNILLNLCDGNIVIENDWLGSIPVFYNTRNKSVSTISNFCIEDKAIHNEGLSNFCEFGYSVFEHTMFKNVNFMRYFSKLVITENSMDVEYKNDPVLKKSFIEHERNEDDVIHLMQQYILNIEQCTRGEIVLPTSGGYDSRLLNYLVKDKTRIRSFTYGISNNQSQSRETLYAKKISEIYNTKWQQIELTNFHKYIDKWFDIYGISTHMHGMYHIEFYKQMLIKNQFKSPTFLSGIFGDIWAGSIPYKEAKTWQDIIKISYNHGLSLNLNHLKVANQHNNPLKRKFHEHTHKYLKSNKLKAVFTIRLKIILISYLTQIPEYFGMPVWTPFLNYNIVKATLNIDEKRRKNRIWQKDFFNKHGLDIDSMNIKSSISNSLDQDIMQSTVFEPLDINLLENYFEKKRLLKINLILQNISSQKSQKKVIDKLLAIPKIGGGMRMLGFENKSLKALYDYYVIKAVEKGLKL